MANPPKSPTKDDTSHHTSPTGDTPQRDLTPIRNAQRTVTGRTFKPTLPDHVTKHPEYPGRPKK